MKSLMCGCVNDPHAKNYLQLSRLASAMQVGITQLVKSLKGQSAEDTVDHFLIFETNSHLLSTLFSGGSAIQAARA